MNFIGIEPQLRALGFTGSLNDMLFEYFTGDGALNDRMSTWLATKGFVVGTLNDKWYAYLGSLGYTGALNDRFFKWVLEPTNPIMAATGGDVTIDGDYKIHTFNTDGTFSVTAGGLMDVLCVGGGGGAGFSNINHYHGGGGGASLPVQMFSNFTPGDYAVVVGVGGDAGYNPAAQGLNGGDSTINSLVSQGGGGGGGSPGTTTANPNTYGKSGGNGGGGGAVAPGAGVSVGGSPLGAGYAGADGTDNNSGWGGGGGGAGGAAPAPTDLGSAGGDGIISSITGATVTYCSGGIAGGTASVANTGPGSGGNGNILNVVAHPGVNGVVIVRYKFQ